MHERRREHSKQVHDKLEFQIKTVGAKLDTLKARAEAAKANVEIKAIAELLPKKQAIQQKLQDLKKTGRRPVRMAATAGDRGQRSAPEPHELLEPAC